MKNSFTLLELIVVISLLSIISSIFYFKKQDDKLLSAAKRLELYLKQTRYQALIDSKQSVNDSIWHKKRWTLKFFNCKSSIGGFYYVIYSDENKKGHPNENESLIDPLSKKRVYSSNSCEYTNNRSKYVLLTKEYGIKNIEVSCNSTAGVGQISFGNDGKVYTKLSSYDNESSEYELKNKCTIDLYINKTRRKRVEIYARTGYVRVR